MFGVLVVCHDGFWLLLLNCVFAGFFCACVCLVVWFLDLWCSLSVGFLMRVCCAAIGVAFD